MGWAGTSRPNEFDAGTMGHDDHVPHRTDHVPPQHLDRHPLADAGAVLVAQLGDAAGIGGRRGHRPRLVNVVGHRLLAEDVLARGQRGGADGGVHVVGHGGVERIDAVALAREHLPPVGVFPRVRRAAGARCQEAGIDVADGHDLGVLAAEE